MGSIKLASSSSRLHGDPFRDRPHAQKIIRSGPQPPRTKPKDDATTLAKLGITDRKIARALAAQFAMRDAEIARLRARVYQLEKSNHAEADIDGEPVLLGANWVSIKRAASRTSRSETGIRKLRDQRKIDATDRGGQWRINVDTIPPLRRVRSRALDRTT
jgi:hypothetical protein